jgi:uncharacterized membrane protein (DUF4010 family)
VTELPLTIEFAFLFGLSFFLGLTFEDVYSRAGIRRPGGVRTFPMLALIGGLLYLIDPTHFVLFAGGLLIVGAWLTTYYREHIREPDEVGRQNVGLMVALLNLYAYLLGGIVFVLPLWVGVGATVAAVLLFTGRERLHALAKCIEPTEIVTPAQFLILTGLVLPLLPDHPVTTLTTVTPRQAWLALVVVCSLSYASYLVQRYVTPKGGALWMAALGGLYSSTATTVVLAREERAQPSTVAQAQAGITLATGIMYLRILVVVAVFNLVLARSLLPWLIGLSALALVMAVIQYRAATTVATPAGSGMNPNPLQLGPAVAFAALFVAISLLSSWVSARFGQAGIYSLAAVVGVTDIDPFVLNIAQGGAAGLSTGALMAAVLIAASSNNVLKAAYALIFGRWASKWAAASLMVLAIVGAGIAVGVLGR